MEMEMMAAGCKIPAFGVWNYCNDLPITQCFDLAIQARLMRRDRRRGGGGGGGDGSGERQFPFNASPSASRRPAHIKVMREVAGKQCINGVEEMMQGRYGTKRKVIATKAVDEDLYKVPHPLIYQKPRKVQQS